MIDYRKLWYETREIADKETLIQYPEYKKLNDLDDYNRKVLMMKSNSIFWNLLDTQIEKELHEAIPQKSHVVFLLFLFDKAVEEKNEEEPDWRKWRESSIEFCQEFFNRWSFEKLDQKIRSSNWQLDYSSIDDLWNTQDKNGILFYSDLLCILKLKSSEVFQKEYIEFESGDYFCKVHVYKNDDETAIAHTNLYLTKQGFIEDKMIQIGGDGGVTTVYINKRSREIMNLDDFKKYQPLFAQAIGFTLNGAGKECEKMVVYFDSDELNNACINESQWTNQLMENAFAWAHGEPTDPDVWVDEEWLQYGNLIISNTFEWQSEQFIPANYLSESYRGLPWTDMAIMIQNFITQAKPSIMDFLDSLGIEYSEDILIPNVE